MFIVHMNLVELIVWGIFGLLVLACIAVVLGCIIAEQFKRLYRWARARPFLAICLVATEAMLIYALVKCCASI